MKQIFSLLFFGIIAQALWAQTPVASKIESVTVYLSGAQVVRKAELTLQKGEAEVSFEGLAASIDMGSIQFTAPGVKIISVLPSLVSYLPADSLRKLEKFKDSLEIYQSQIARINREANGFKAERKLMDVNMSRIGTEKGVSLLELQNFSAYYQKRVYELENKDAEYSEQKKLWETRKNRLENKINNLQAQARDAYNINVKLKAEAPVKLPVVLSYVALNAGWSPFYDVRVKNVSEKVKFAYRASIINDSKEDWKNIKLKLSSANPTLSTDAPFLDIWRLDFIRYYANAEKGKFELPPNSQNTLRQSIATESEDDWGGEGEESVSRAALDGGAEVNISALSVEFEIKDLYTILSDGQYYSVDVNEYDLVAQYTYKCVPKLDRDAFLIANVVGWEQLNLIEGKMNLYFGDTYVGDSYLNPRSASDTLKLSLGRDKKVIVKRVEVKDFSKSAFIGSNKRETMTTEIEVRNTNNIPVEIEIVDQIPVSKNSDIEITPDNLGGATHNQEKGELSWIIKLKETESKKFRFEYTVKYPKSKSLERSNYQSPQNQRKMYRK